MIAVGGENLIDLFARCKAGSDDLELVAVPGGGPFNVATAIGRLGHEVSYLTPISSDIFGDILRARLLQSNVSIASARVQNPSSLAVVSIDSKGTPSYRFYRDGTAERQVRPSSLASAIPRDTKIFHVGGLALIDGEDAEVWKQRFELCNAKNILTSLDPNIRPALVSNREQYVRRLRKLIKIADILKLSDEDLKWLYPNQPLEKALANCRANCNAAMLILTLGADGARGFVAAGDVSIPAAKTHQIIDTVGAGDTFMASILGWVIETGCSNPDSLRKIDINSLKLSLTLAAKAAAMNCEQSGCNPPWRHQLDH